MFGHNSLDDYYEHTVREFPLSSRALLAATVGVCGLLSKVLWPWRIENGERLWNAEGGRMVVMNHVSMLDPVVLVVSDWAHGRRIRPIYKSEFDKHRIVTWFFARVGAIPVNRGTADIKAVRRAQRALQRGEDVLVFPEGTRIHSDEQEVEVHGGFALMAQLAKVPVVPVAIVGARDGAPGGNKPLRPHRVFMRVGEPATFDGLGVKGRKKQAKAMEALAMERVYALRDALRDEHPGKM
jgi:1-acyl-sn-glycerol-3-phosphate acyltransferase